MRSVATIKLGVLLVLAGSALIVGRMTAGDGPRLVGSAGTRVPPAELTRHFIAMVGAWNQYIVSHGGYVPLDRYALLDQLGCVDGYEELRNYSVPWPFPPRLNPILSLNPKWKVFSIMVSDTEELACFADGTWGRTSGGEDKWLQAMQSGGYPVFALRTTDQLMDWTTQNAHKLVWSPSGKIFVPRNPAAAPTQPSSCREK